MSSSLSVYLLDVAAARAPAGSGDEQLLQVIRESFGDDEHGRYTDFTAGRAEAVAYGRAVGTPEDQLDGAE